MELVKGWWKRCCKKSSAFHSRLRRKTPVMMSFSENKFEVICDAIGWFRNPFPWLKQTSHLDATLLSPFNHFFFKYWCFGLKTTFSHFVSDLWVFAMSPLSCLVLAIFAAVLVPRGSKSDLIVNVGEDNNDGLEQVCDTFPLFSLSYSSKFSGTVSD